MRWDSGSTADLAYGFRHDEEQGLCPAEHAAAEFSVDGTTITWRVPKALLAVDAGAQLTVARADAWSGDTWPMTPSDRADRLPSRPYAVASGAAAPPAEQAAAADETAPAPAPPVADAQEEPPADGEPGKDTPALPSALLLLGLAAAALVRRRP